MLLETKIVHVPAQRERDADQAEYGALGVKTRGSFGRAACEAGDPDHTLSDPRTSAADTIANILHWVALDVPPDQAENRALDVVENALMHFRHEYGEARAA